MEKDRIESLVNRAQSGDLQAMEKLLEVAHTSVSYQCRKMMPRQEDAEDLTQEVLLAVYQKIDTLKEAKAFWSWLNRITATHCMNALSRNHVDLQFAEDEDGHSVVDDLEVLDEHSIPDKALDNAETARMIDEIVSGLPEAQRMSTLLYYYNEMSVKEIAQIMNVPENTVKSRLNLARKAIKDKVLDYEKQGVKLYSVSILPFLWYFLRTAAESQANTGAAAACASGVVTTATVTTTTAATTGATVTGAVTTGIAAKIVAGCLALVVAVGGAALYFGGQDPADTTQQTPTTSETGTQSPETSESTISKPSLNDQAMEVYDALLRREYTDNSLPIHYYTYIDLDHDNVSELIVANNDGTEDSWTECEIYTYDDSGLKFYTKLSIRYDNLYYVNNTYLLTANKSIYYYSPSHSIEVVSYHWNEDETRNDPAISVDGGEWEYITSDEYKFYSSNDGGFVESKGIVKLEKNPYSRSNAEHKENLINTFSREQQRMVNIFLSNFAEQSFTQFPVENDGVLLRFVFLYNKINSNWTEHVTIDGEYYDVLTDDIVDTVLDRFFGISIEHRKMEASWPYSSIYEYQDGKYYTVAADGDQHNGFAIVDEMYQNEDGTYVVQYSVYHALTEYGGTSWDIAKYYELFPTEISNYPEIEKLSTGTATLRGYTKDDGTESYQVITLN